MSEEPEWHKKWPTNANEWRQRCPLFEFSVKHSTDEKLHQLRNEIEKSNDECWKRFSLTIINRELRERDNGQQRRDDCANTGTIFTS